MPEFGLHIDAAIGRSVLREKLDLDLRGEVKTILGRYSSTSSSLWSLVVFGSKFMPTLIKN